MNTKLRPHSSLKFRRKRYFVTDFFALRRLLYGDDDGYIT